MSKITIIIKMFIILSCEVVANVEELEYPEILTKIGAYKEPIFNSTENFIFPDNFDRIQLECKTSYPNKWTFSSNPLRDGHNIFEIDKTRTAKDINDNSTYTYTSVLTLKFKNPTINQNVSCSHNMRKFEKYLNLTTLVYLITTPNKELIVRVEKGMQLEKSEGLHPRFGLNQNCTVFIHIDKDAQTYGCSNVDPTYNNKTIPRIVSCNDNDECDAYIRNDKNCSSSLIRSCKSPTCSKLPKNNEGAIICQFGNTSVARAVFLTAQDPTTYYIRGDDVNVTDVLQVRLLNSSLALNNSSLFRNETIRLSCIGAASYFSKGFRWGIQFGVEIEYIENNTSMSDSYSKESRTYTTEIEIHLNSTNITGIICYAPVWNSYRYEEMVFPITVRVIPIPIIVDENVTDSETVSTGGSVVTMECKLVDENVPSVTFTWSKNGQDLLCIQGQSSINTTSCNIENTSVSTRLTVSDSSESSNYTCMARNKKEETRVKHFVVTVKSFPYTILLASGGGILISLVILISFLFYKNRSQSLTIQNLSEDDISEFVNGDPNSDNALFYPYNVQFEISRKDFSIESKVLGSGQFGIVLKGRLGKAPIAIKAVKKGADVNYVKALLSELKIMSFVGRHDNLVSLLGACTENISKCEVYVICEYCANGNVLKYVQESREHFVDHNPHQKYGSFRRSMTDYQNSSVKKLSSKDLLRWAYEIASGMEYLSSKKVIHGDLAARNILLTESLIAKVGDFGLSKQLFQYSVYVQRLECPLPLRWMAIESLQDLEFSVQSDVWSYGVTLWEIFTLGQSPYPGVNWNFESWKMLRDGYRMDKPQYASENTYKKILECWDVDLNRRPDFTALKEFFEGQNRMLLVAQLKGKKGLR